MSQSETNNVMNQLEQRRLEMMKEQQEGTISIGEARHNITPLDSLFPRVSLADTEQEGGTVTDLVINVRALSFSSIDDLTSDAAILKARLLSKIKFPTRDIENIRVISAKDITLPLINIPTGRKFYTIEIKLK